MKSFFRAHHFSSVVGTESESEAFVVSQSLLNVDFASGRERESDIKSNCLKGKLFVSLLLLQSGWNRK